MASNPRPQARVPRLGLLYLILFFWLMLYMVDVARVSRNTEMIPYSQLLAYIDENQVETLAIGTREIRGMLKSPPEGKPKAFLTLRLEDPALTDRLLDHKVKFTAVQESTWLRDILSWIVPALVIAGFWMWAMRRFSGAGAGPRGGGGLLSIGKSKARIYAEKSLKTRFTDVAGVDEAKEELGEIVNFLKDPARYSKLGGRMPKGVLLVGPPGTGKTLLGRAVAGEAGVPFFSINGSEFVELFVGLGAARVRDLFEQARAQAPCIIFIDELDALGKARGVGSITGAANDEKEQTLNQLLAEMDGFDSSQGIIVLAATNRPEVLDPALLRAGRFDRHVLIDKPDRLGRRQILEIHMRRIKAEPEVSLEVLASMTAGFSGADLANLVNEAALIATRRGAERVTARDFTAGIERIVAGLERRSRVLLPDEKRRVAFHEMGHAVVALSAGHGEEVHKVSVIPRGLGALGYTLRRSTEDRYLMSKPELESKLAMLLGGRVSELEFLAEISTGAADDLDKATEIARAMITRYGMSEELGLAILEREQASMLGTGAGMRTFEYSEMTAQKIDRQIREMLDRALESARSIIRKYRAFVQEGAAILVSRETLDEAELKALWLRHSGRPAAPSGPVVQIAG